MELCGVDDDPIGASQNPFDMSRFPFKITIPLQVMWTSFS